MSAGPPRRPQGPPPRPAEGTQGVTPGANVMRRPAGPPPAVTPVIGKPPPMQPPLLDPDTLAQRPTVQNIRSIEPPKMVAPFSIPPPRPRAPPPHSTPPSVLDAAEETQTAGTPSRRVDSYMMPGMMSVRVAPPKNILSSQGRWSQKPGAVPMFQPKDSVSARPPPSESKTEAKEDEVVEFMPSIETKTASVEVVDVGEVVKPPPPVRHPSGIPVDKAPPPVDAPELLTKPPAPTRPPPNRNRAPPTIAPEEEASRKRLPPPLSEAPFKRPDPVGGIGAWGAETEKKHVEEEYSSDEEEGVVVGKTKDEVLTFDLVKSASIDAAVATIPAPAEAAEEEVASLVMRHSLPKPSIAVSSLKGGRLSVRLVEGVAIAVKGSKASADPYVKLRLGASDKTEWRKSEVVRKGTENPSFNNELMTFDVIDPSSFAMEGDIQLVGEIWLSGMFDDKLFGSFNLSIMQIMSTPFITFNESLSVSVVLGLPSLNTKLLVDIMFEEARTGMAVITLYEAKGLRNIDPLGNQRPYVSLSLGKGASRRSKAVEDGPTDPYFAEEELQLWSDASNWMNDLIIEILDEDIGKSKPIGTASVSLLTYMNYTIPLRDAILETLVLGGAGQLSFKVKFFPAGVLQIQCKSGKNLAFPETYISPTGSRKIDPYVTFTMSSVSHSASKRTPAEKDGGSNPLWNYDIIFDVVDQYMLDIEVYHQNITGGADVLLGYGQLSLLPMFKKGEINTWVTLKQKKSNGGIIEKGDINIVFKFSGPTGLAFPQNRAEVDSFDETTRKTKIGAPRGIRDITVPTKPQDSDYVPEFTDDEIRAAFNFIDLDHNSFVGASEIRHILVCMGELITDEEIDMMISMIDLDGDGQVSYTEFRFLVLHPKPGDADLLKEMATAKEHEILADKTELSLVSKNQGVTDGADLSTHHRQREMLLRESKREALTSFTIDVELDFEEVQLIYAKYQGLMNEQPMLAGLIPFEMFCGLFKVEPISEYKHLFSLFDEEELQRVNFKEFLLSLLNFIEVDKDKKVKFAFQMYDERRTNFISLTEVELILKGNHMLGIDSVVKKAETIMKQSTSSSKGFVTLDEFQAISRKFPNILFPVFQAPGKTKAVTSLVVPLLPI